MLPGVFKSPRGRVQGAESWTDLGLNLDLLTGWFWASYITCLKFSFLIYKLGQKIHPAEVLWGLNCIMYVRPNAVWLFNPYYLLWAESSIRSHHPHAPMEMGLQVAVNGSIWACVPVWWGWGVSIRLGIEISQERPAGRKHPLGSGEEAAQSLPAGREGYLTAE